MHSPRTCWRPWSGTRPLCHILYMSTPWLQVTRSLSASTTRHRSPFSPRMFLTNARSTVTFSTACMHCTQDSVRNVCPTAKVVPHSSGQSPPPQRYQHAQRILQRTRPFHWQNSGWPPEQQGTALAGHSSRPRHSTGIRDDTGSGGAHSPRDSMIPEMQSQRSQRSQRPSVPARPSSLQAAQEQKSCHSSRICNSVVMRSREHARPQRVWLPDSHSPAPSARAL